MGWVRLDDQFHTNEKAVAAGADGRALYIAGLCWCARNLTDGYIDKRALPVIAALAGVEPNVADTLSAVDVGLWEDEGARYRVPDYLDYHPSRQQVIAEREAATERKRRSRQRSRGESHRDGRGTDAVTSAASVPYPRESSSSSSSDYSTGNRTRPVDDDELSTGGVPDETWTVYAELMLAKQPSGTVRQPVSWKKTTAKNARIEHGARALEWWTTYETRPHDLAGWLIDGKPSHYAQRREQIARPNAQHRETP